MRRTRRFYKTGKLTDAILPCGEGIVGRRTPRALVAGGLANPRLVVAIWARDAGNKTTPGYIPRIAWVCIKQKLIIKEHVSAIKLMLIVHKSFHNIAPIYISELLKVYTPSRNLRSSNMSLLKEPTSKRTWGDRSFSVAAPRLWNHLPTKLKS